MSIDTYPTTTGDISSASPRRSLPVTGVIAASLVTGVVNALVLTLVVFPGATEAVITGSMLLAAGFGWAMMAVLSVRTTSQPQRWAAVPAVAMSAAGLALLVFAPGDATLASVAWVWPPVVLALVVWMTVSMRRALTGRGRWLLAPVLVVLAVAGVGATTENVLLLRDHHAYPAPGRTFEVAGHRLHLDCRGHGGPTVVLFNGLGEISASWARITDEVGVTTRVCAYDRAGQGWSEDAASPQDGVTAARDLHLLLAEAGEAGPLRPRRPLDRRPLRPDLRRAVPRAGRRHGAPGQLQSRAAHHHPELPRPVRDDATRPGAAPHVRTAGSGPGVRRLGPPRRGG